MNHTARIADLPLSARRKLELGQQQEIEDGLMRRHVQNATEKRDILAAQFAAILRVGPALATKLRGE